jgi:hypothetical protein
VFLFGAAGWLFFNDFSPTITERDRAIIVTARDIEQWLPGLSALNGEETFSKKQVGGGVQIEYSFENLKKEPRTSILCYIVEKATEADCAISFQTGQMWIGMGQDLMSSVLADRAKAAGQDQVVGGPPLEIRDDLLPWGDGSNAWKTRRVDGFSTFSYRARKGRRLISLILTMGPGLAIDDDGLRRILRPRLEALARADA